MNEVLSNLFTLNFNPKLITLKHSHTQKKRFINQNSGAFERKSSRGFSNDNPSFV